MQPVNSKPKIGQKQTLLLLAVAGALLIGALVWRIVLEKNSLSSRIVRELAAHGLTVEAADLYQHEHRQGTTVAEMMADTDLTPAIEASRAAGFPSDVSRAGEVYCLLAGLADGTVLTVFVVDEEIELAFLQLPGEENVLPVNAGAEADNG